MQSPDIEMLMAERQALRGLADQALRFRGELNGTSETADYIQRVIDETVDRWAVSDRQAREALRSNQRALASVRRIIETADSPPVLDALATVAESLEERAAFLQFGLSTPTSCAPFRLVGTDETQPHSAHPVQQHAS